MRFAAHCLLAYTCSLLLALPCGWCCALPVPAPKSKDPIGAAPVPADTCCCCYKQVKPTDGEPVRPPVPVKCRICVEKAALVTPTREHFDSAVLVLPLVPLDQRGVASTH